MTLFVWLFVIIVPSLSVEFSEEVKSNHSVDVDHNDKQHDSKDQLKREKIDQCMDFSIDRNYLFPVVSDRLKNGLQSLDCEGNIEQMSGEEKVIKITKY